MEVGDIVRDRLGNVGVVARAYPNELYFLIYVNEWKSMHLRLDSDTLAIISDGITGGDWLHGPFNSFELKPMYINDNLLLHRLLYSAEIDMRRQLLGKKVRSEKVVK